MKYLTWLYSWARYAVDRVFAPHHRIRALEQELADFESLSELGVHADGSSIDMTFTSAPARVLAGMWVEFFHQNGGKNFVTMEMRMADPWHRVKKRPLRAFQVTVQAVDGKSPAQVNQELRDEVARLRALLDER